MTPSSILPRPMPPSTLQIKTDIKPDLIDYIRSRGQRATNRMRVAELRETAHLLRAAHLIEWKEHTTRLLTHLMTTKAPERTLQPPEGWDDEPSQGWDFNVYGETVYEAWSTRGSHGTGTYSQDSDRRSSSRGPLALYPTREAALEAMAHALLNKMLGTLGKLADI